MASSFLPGKFLFRGIPVAARPAVGIWKSRQISAAAASGVVLEKL